MYPDIRRASPRVLHFTLVIPLSGFTAVPAPRNAIDIIIGPILNALDFKAVQAAIICNAFPAFAIFAFCHCNHPFTSAVK